MNHRQHDSRMYRPRNPSFSSETRNQRPFFRHQNQNQSERGYQHQPTSDIRHFSQTGHIYNPSQFPTNQNMQQNTIHRRPPFPAPFQNNPPSQSADPARNQPHQSYMEPRVSCAGDGMQNNEFHLPIASAGMALGQNVQQRNQEGSQKNNYSVPPFERRDITMNQFETVEQTVHKQYSGPNNFNMEQNNPTFQNNTRSQDPGNFFTKKENNQPMQVQIPGLDTVPESTIERPISQGKNLSFQMQGHESSMENFQNQSWKPANLPQSSGLGREQIFMGFQGIQPQQIEKFQSPNVQQPMMSFPPPPRPSFPPPPRPQFLNPEINTRQPMMRHQENNVSAPIAQAPNFQNGAFQNPNFSHNQMESGFMQQNIKRPLEMSNEFSSETHKVQPYQPKRTSSEFLSMQSNIQPNSIKPNDFKSSTNLMGMIMKGSMSDKEKDEHWINSWLLKKGKQTMEQTIPEQFGTNVYGVQEKVKRMMFLMASLQKQIKVLSICDRSQFHEEMRTASKLKEEMDTIRKFLSAVETEELGKKVKRRVQKRERMKKRRQTKYLTKQRELEYREQLHKEIDERLNKIYKENEDKRQQKELKKTADKILSEVRKKTQETTRAADLLKNLKKLRKLRRERLSQQGIVIKPETDVDFDDKIRDTTAVLHKQQKVYNAENKALNVILETEQEENLEKEREKQEQILRNKEMKRLKKEKRLMFGDTEPCDMNDPMFMFQQFYDQASMDINSLVQIRCDWDRFCVAENTPGGCRIPDGFVIPEKPSTDVWASALKEDT